MEPTAQSLSPKGNKTLTIVLIFLGFIVLVLLSEGAYYLFNQYVKRATTIRPTPQPAETTPAPFLQDQESFSAPGDLFKESSKNYDIARVQLQNLTNQLNTVLADKSEFVKNLTISEIIGGKVSDTSFEDKTFDNIKYVFSITIKTKDGGKTLKAYFSNNEILTTKTILTSGGKKTSIKLTEIKAGDYVLSKDDTDILTGSTISTIEVTRD